MITTIADTTEPELGSDEKSAAAPAGTEEETARTPGTDTEQVIAEELEHSLAAEQPKSLSTPPWQR